MIVYNIDKIGIIIINLEVPQVIEADLVDSWDPVSRWETGREHDRTNKNLGEIRKNGEEYFWKISVEFC